MIPALLASVVVGDGAAVAQTRPVLRKSAAELSAMPWAEIVDFLLDSSRATDDQAHEAHLGRLRTLLDRKGVTYIRCTVTAGGERLQTDIYYQPGELHVVHAPSVAAAKPEKWNLVVKQGKAYEWRTGETQGIVGKVTDNDMIEYLIYLTDPALFLSSTYQDFLRRPEKFLSPTNDSRRPWTEIRYKNPEHGINALFVRPAPTWYYGIELTQDDAVLHLEFDLPRSVDAVPAENLDRIDGIQFMESNLSVRRHMLFL